MELHILGSPELHAHHEMGAVTMDGWATFKVPGDAGV
jgi:hypothetical protein